MKLSQSTFTHRVLEISNYIHKIANRILCYQLNCFRLQGKKQKIDLRRLFAFLVDVDECQSPDACHSDHVCNNTVGSYTCECPLGFAVDSGPQNPVNPVCVGKALILNENLNLYYIANLALSLRN